MIDSVHGTLLSKGEGHVVVECGGIGYRVGLSANSLAEMPAIGADVFVWTYLSVREDAISLYGFTTEDERALFGRLIGVSGVGPKVALAALSTFSPDALMRAIAEGDSKQVARIPGVGKKTAQRIVLELKGSAEDILSGQQSLIDRAAVPSDAQQALLAMGFTLAEARIALEGYDGDSEDSGAAVRYGLKRLGAMG